MKKALLIAYHYPPVKVSSGLQRTLSFSKYLKLQGWQPMVLTVNKKAYINTSEDQLKDIPKDMLVKRAFALDSGRHLAVNGRYSDSLALPDRWISWWLGGVVSGLIIILKHKPKIIFSTYPIATAHLIGLTLHKLTGIPWVADFRDSMTEPDYPPEPKRRRIFQWIERKTIYSCERAIFTTPGAVEMYKSRYPEAPDSKWELVPNGYDEDVFNDVLQLSKTGQEKAGGFAGITLLHSGVLYPSERDPKDFFSAISRLKREGHINSLKVKVILRATGHDEIYQPMLAENDIEDIVQLLPGVSYREALQEMMEADGLLIFQAANCNHQIPAKLYEYFKANRPILALTDMDGDTAKTMLAEGISSIAPLDDENKIAESLLSFIRDIEKGDVPFTSLERIKLFSRRHSSEILAGIFSSLIDAN